MEPYRVRPTIYRDVIILQDGGKVAVQSCAGVCGAGCFAAITYCTIADEDGRGRAGRALNREG